MSEIEKLREENKILAEALVEKEKLLAASEFMAGMAEPVTITDTPLRARPIAQSGVWQAMIDHGKKLIAARDREGLNRMLWKLTEFASERWNEGETTPENWFSSYPSQAMELISDFSDRFGADFERVFGEWLEQEAAL